MLQRGRHNGGGNLLFTVGLCISSYCYFHPRADKGGDALKSFPCFSGPTEKTVLFRSRLIRWLVGAPRVFCEEIAGDGEGSGAAPAAHLSKIASPTPASRRLSTQALK